MALLPISYFSFIITFVRRIRVNRQWVWKFLFRTFLTLFFKSRLLLLDVLYLLSSDELDSLDDESDDDESESGYSGTCYFLLRFNNSLGRVSGLGSRFLLINRSRFQMWFFSFVVFVPIWVDSKGGRPIKMFWRSIVWFYLQVWNPVL